MKGIEFDIIHHSEESQALQSLDLNPDMDTGVTNKMTFYSICAIGRHEEDNGKEYGVIFCAGEQFYTYLKYEELAEALSKF